MSLKEYHESWSDSPGDETKASSPDERFFRTGHKSFEATNFITASVWLEIANRGEKYRRAGFKIINKGGTVMRSWSGQRQNGDDFFTLQTFGDSEVCTFAEALEWIGQTLRRFQSVAEEKAMGASLPPPKRKDNDGQSTD